MEAAHNGIIEPDKSIVCGHWHCSFGHARYEHDGSEFESNANFTPYRANGIIALDACTALSGKVNCIVIEYCAEYKQKSGCWPMQPNSRNCASRPMMTSKAACGLRLTKAESAYD